MGLAIRSEKGKDYPVLTCDACGKPIEDWRLAIASFPWPTEEPVTVQVYHKGDCDPGAAGRREEHAKLWQQLDHYLPWLLWNNKWGARDSTKQGDKLTIDVPSPLDI